MANVSEFHVKYMRSFATEWRQVRYLCQVLEGMSRRPGDRYEKRVVFKLDISRELKNRLKNQSEHGSLNATINSLLREWSTRA